MTDGIFNLTNTTNFLFSVSDSKLTEAFTLSLQKVNTPSVSIPVTHAPGQSQGISTGAFPGSGFEFEPLSLQFIVDSKLESWVQMYKWMLSVNNYVNRDESGWDNNDTQKPAVLNILNNEKDDVIMAFRFYGAFCSELSDIEWDYTTKDNPAMICTAIINYRVMEVEYGGEVVRGRVTDSNSNSAIYSNLSTKSLALHPSMRTE